MKTSTDINLPSATFIASDNIGRKFDYLIVKASFDIDNFGNCRLCKDQDFIFPKNKYIGDMNKSSLHYPSDIVSYKPTTDIILNGSAISPTSNPLASWDVSINIENQISNYMKVYGKRYWIIVHKEKKPLQLAWNNEERHKLYGWQLTEPEPTIEVPLIYENAFGGEINYMDNDEEHYVCNDYNPVGCGMLNEKMFIEDNIEKQYLAPQIEELSNPITDPYKTYKPAGTLALDNSWKPRIDYAGTYDEYWQKNIAPKYPKDYDFHHNNSAHPKMQSKSWLNGNEKILLNGLDIKQVSLPNIGILIELQRGVIEKEYWQAPLDTVFIDLNGKKLYLSWRITYKKESIKHLFFTVKKCRDMETIFKASYVFNRLRGI